MSFSRAFVLAFSFSPFLMFSCFYGRRFLSKQLSQTFLFRVENAPNEMDFLDNLKMGGL